MYFITPELGAAIGARFFIYTGSTDQDIPGFVNNTPGRGRLNLKIDGAWHFMSERLTLSYPTLYLDEDTPVDTGVCLLSAQFMAGDSQIQFTNAYVKLDTIAAPGRVPVQQVTPADAPPTGLNIEGYPWPAFYQANGSIIVDIENRSTAPVLREQLQFTWAGWNIPTRYIEDAQAFFDKVKEFGIARPVGM